MIVVNWCRQRAQIDHDHEWGRPRLRRRGIWAAGMAGLIALAACGSGGGGSAARTYLSWADGATSTIGRADLNGAGVSQRFISTGGAVPYMVTVSSGFLYWTSPLSGAIGRASLDGTAVSQRFITGASEPTALAVGSRYIYWANSSTATIGRADVNGSAVDQRFIAIRTGKPFGVAVAPGS